MHLESSNALMAEDLLSKTAVIEHYMMDSRQAGTVEHWSLLRLSMIPLSVVQ